jgi:hypothetical protein
VLSDTVVERLPRAADIVSAIGAAEHVDVDGVVAERLHRGGAVLASILRGGPKWGRASG